MLSSSEIVDKYFELNYKPVIWPQIGDSKGPREDGWPSKSYKREDYHDGDRIGLLTGTEIVPGQYLHDVDIDWAVGSHVAMRLLPSTEFVFGRVSKKFSHCFYHLPQPLPSVRYEDIDKTCLLELRGTKTNGDVGFQTMVPPSVWSKDGKQEPLTFLKHGPATFIDNLSGFKQSVCLAAIGMLFARHFGTNGFGHEVRLCWSGFLLRAGIDVETLVLMGEGISSICNNLEVHDVRRSVESTAASLAAPGKKVKGGPALAKILGQDGKAVLAKVNEWLGRESDFLRNSEGMIIKDSQENIRRAIAMLDVELSYNTYAERMLIKEHHEKEKILDDYLDENLWLRIDKEFHFRPTKMFFDIVLKNITHDNEVHPVREYLGNLRWDGVDRIDRWLERYGKAEDSKYLRAVSSIVLIAAVKRVMHPGCKYDEMLVLESEQGMNKSTALRTLCPEDSWFSDDFPLNVDSKQVIECTLGKWIIEASDLSGGRKADRDHLKSMLSRPIDGPARMAYAHIPVERARQFIIIGTTNNAAYLGDMTGARRFWPVRVKNFDVKGILKDRDQLWAEAVVREAAGESIRLPEELWKDAAEHQEARREIDAWEHIISDAVENIQPNEAGRKQIITNVIWELLGIEVARRDRLGAMRISEIMQRLGFVRHRIRDEDKQLVVGYIRDSNVKVLPFEKEGE